MRLRLRFFGGAAVILALSWTSQHAGGAVAPVAGLCREEGRSSPAAQDTARQGARPPPQDTTPPGIRSVPQDTVTAVAAGSDTSVAADTTGLGPGPGRVRLGLKTLPLPFPVDLLSRLVDPASQLPELRSRVRSWGEIWEARVTAQLAEWQAAVWRDSRPVAIRAARRAVAEPEAEELAVGEIGVDSAVAELAPVEPAPAAESESELLPDVFGEYADLGIAVQGRVEVGGGWNRFRPCDVTVQFNCNPSLIPTLKPDIQFGARVGGTISDRIHVSVDYDNRREFDAANNINVFYQGLEDEILQRIEVGDVSLSLPQSRYLTQGIPAGNFGFRTTGQVGPIDFQAVWAQQKGDIGTRELQVGGGGQGFEQSATTILDDADYERGRFLFLFTPRRLSGHPDIDIQRLVASDAPVDVRPASVVKVYRYETLGYGAGGQVPEGFIKAIAVAFDTVRTSAGADTVVTDTLTGLFRPLVDGEDYILHQSGLWLQLRNTLADREGLAITYVAADGTQIGTFNAEEVSDAHIADPENVEPPVLELIKGVNHRPGTATWRREMHHVYRVSASPGVVTSSLEVIISQGDPELGNTFRALPEGQQLEMLKIFGFDDDPTDNRIDASRIYEPPEVGAGTTAGLSGTYLIPPTLEPFRRPPPLRDVPGFSGQPFPLDPGDQNPVIYDESNDQVRRGANLYLLTISYRQRFEGFLSSISLGAGGVREASEKLVIDNVELVRGEDYTIDYDIGQIELREPERWFQNNPNARVHVAFEQKPLFQLAPTSVFGFQARYGLGERGELNFVGLSQREKTLQTRPELGLEPSAVQLGGISGRLDFRPNWLTQLVSGLPGLETEAPSTISLDGELAVSVPNSNTQGVTYVEDFEGGSGFSLFLTSRAWRLGSAPPTAAGAEAVAPSLFTEGNAAELVWQDQYVVQTSEGQVTVGGLLPQDIDQELRIQGQVRPEPVLTISALLPENRSIAPNPNPPAGPAWRSMTTVISPTGQDFTTIEYLEFYVAVPEELRDSTSLIIDMGTVSEDGFGIDSLGQASGIGRLDREVDPPNIWSNADDVGLWDSGCEAEPRVRAYSVGDVAANCTRNNGLEDTEDLNQNSVLDADERFFRYTVRIGDPSSPYFVRDANDFGPARFRLFRIPLRRPDHRERVSDAEFQNIRHLRFTLVTESNNRLILARVRFLGSRWLKRGRAGVVTGLADTTSALLPEALVEVGPISTLDARYIPPPGITDQVANQAEQFSIGGMAINEQSLSIRFSEVGAGERAEVFLQYPQTPRDLLGYRSLRLWALGVDGPWGTAGEPLRLLVKLGEDARNFYMFQAPLQAVPPDAQGEELRQAWLPEIEIDFDRFIRLRAAAEELMLRQGGLPPDSVLELWDFDVFEDGDSSYAIVISQRSRAPNLAAVRQISLGAYNSGADIPISGELWVDDFRLTAPVDNTGVVSRLNVDIRAADFLSLNFSYSGENPYFRQLAQSPSFRSAKQYSIGGQLRLGRMLPGSWGMNLPLTLSYSSSSSEPLLLPRTDVPAEQLRGLRRPSNRGLSLGFGIDRQSPVAIPLVGWFIDNSALRFSYDRRTNQNSRSSSESDVIRAGYSFRHDVVDISLPLFPGPLAKLFFFLPAAVRESRLRLTPQSVQLNASYVDAETETRRFEQIIELPSDTAAVPIRMLDQQLQTNATVNLEPLTSLTGRVTLNQTRELVPTAELVQGQAARRVIEAERSKLAGLDLGWETARVLNVNWTYRPDLAAWLTPQASFDTRFRFDRGPSFVAEQEGDTVLTRDFDGSRSLRLSASLNPLALLQDAFGANPSGLVGVLSGLLGSLDLISGTYTNSLGSSYQRRTASPDLAYHLGLASWNGFRVQDGDTTSRLIDNVGTSLSSGLRLPLGANLNVDFSQSKILSWTPISRSRNRNTSWPRLTINWARLPLPSFLDRWVRSLGLRTGYTLRTTRSEVLGADQTRESETRSIPLSVDLALTTDWSLNFNLTMTDGERRDPTGTTLSDQANHSIQVSGRIPALAESGMFANPLRTVVRFSQDSREECRQLGGALEPPEPAGLGSECEPFTDLRIRRVDVTIGADMRPFILGLQGFWRDTQSELGQRPGSTQLEISVFGQFLLETGEIR